RAATRKQQAKDPCGPFLQFPCFVVGFVGHHFPAFFGRPGFRFSAFIFACTRRSSASSSRTWPGDRRLERQLKRRKDAPHICPICAGAAAMNRAKEKNQ